jgi:HK97 family phage portal protein
MILDQYGRPYTAPQNSTLENPAMSLQDPATWDGVLQGASESGAKVTARRVIGYAPVWRGMNLIASGTAKLPLIVYQRDGENGRTRATKHAAYRLLKNQPNKHITAFAFRETLTFHAMLYGNGFAGIFRDANGIPEDLLILDPQTTVVAQVAGEVWYLAKFGDEERKIPARDVLHIHGLGYDGLVGYSVLDLMRDELGLGIATRSYAARFFGQGSNAAGILMVPAGYDETQTKNLVKYFNEMATGLARAHKAFVLPGGATWQKTSIDPEQAMLHETQGHEVRVAANILCLPPHKLGDASKSSYNSLEQENRAYLQDSLDPWLCRWESESNAKLLSDKEREADSHYCEFIRDALERTDTRNEIAGLVEELNNGLVNLDEARAIRNRPPAPDGQGKKFRRPANITEVGAPNPAAATALNALARERVDRMLQVEIDKATAAAGKASDPVAWGDWLTRSYGQHAEKLVDALKTIVGMACALDGRRDVDGITTQIVTRHIEASKAELSQATGPDAVRSIVAAWPARASILIRDIQGDSHNATAA